MRTISTLPHALQQLMREAPVLRYAHFETDESIFQSRRYPEERAHIERAIRARVARELGDKCLEKATETRDYDGIRRAHRTEFEVVVMSEAELAVLLARASKERWA